MNRRRAEDWVPHRMFRHASHESLSRARQEISQKNWKKRSFHNSFKMKEVHLLKIFRDKVNLCHATNTFPSDKWFNQMNDKWVCIAMMRDYHDFMCGADSKHHIRTDDCRRFIPCVIKGLVGRRFPQPVFRMLRGKTSPKYFTHPKFVQFN